MSTYTLLPNQTLLDATIMATGSLENLFALAAANGYSVTDNAGTGTQLTIPANVTPDTVTLAYYAANNLVAATMGPDDRIFTQEFSDTFS
jgi:hypothetical protein